MRFTGLLSLTLAATTLAHTPKHDVVHRAVSRASSQKRTDTGTTYLPNIISLITPNCAANCTMLETDVTACVDAGGSDMAIAQCSCGASVLADIEECASCIVMDKSTTSGTQALLQYNGFVNQCISVSLAVSSALVSIPPATATQSVETVLYPLSSSSASALSSGASVAPSTAAAAPAGSSTDLAAIAASISNKAVGAKASASASASAKTAGARKVGGWGRAGWVGIVGAGVGAVVLLW